MFEVIMILIIMIFISQVLGFEYLKLEIKKAINNKSGNDYLEGYDDGYENGYNAGYKKGFYAKFIVEEDFVENQFKVTEDGYILARKNRNNQTNKDMIFSRKIKMVKYKRRQNLLEE